MTRAVFVGSNPSAVSKGNGAFDVSTKSGRLLHDWISKAEIHTSILLNVANHPTPNNRALNSKEIKKALSKLKLTLHQCNESGDGAIIAVGKTAVKALTLLQVPFFEMPHPSGMNRQLNDPTFIDKKIEELKEYLDKKAEELEKKKARLP